MLAGAALADVARSGSEGPTAKDGGRQDWTRKGSRGLRRHGPVLFSQPVGPLSPSWSPPPAITSSAWWNGKRPAARVFSTPKKRSKRRSGRSGWKTQRRDPSDSAGEISRLDGLRQRPAAAGRRPRRKTGILYGAVGGRQSSPREGIHALRARLSGLKVPRRCRHFTCLALLPAAIPRDGGEAFWFSGVGVSPR